MRLALPVPAGAQCRGSAQGARYTALAMARVLIVGCGCRGRSLARTLIREGHTVRGTTRAQAGVGAVEAAGAQPWIGDPDRVGTLTSALESVTIVCWLLGSAHGSQDALRALHGPRLRAFCERLVDSTVRGLVYEAAGKIDRGVLGCGRRIVGEAARTWEIPVRMLETDPAEHERWLLDAQALVNALLSAPNDAERSPGSATLGRQIPI